MQILPAPQSVILLAFGIVLIAGTAFAKDTRTFANPTVKGQRLDWCKHWARECGQPAADLYCRQQGFARAANFTHDANVGARGIPTLVFGDGRLCEGPGCSSFGSITCVREASAPPPGPPAAGATAPFAPGSPAAIARPVEPELKVPPAAILTPKKETPAKKLAVPTVPLQAQACPAGSKPTNPGALGTGNAVGSLNGKAPNTFPECKKSGAPKAIGEILDLLDTIAGKFGASITREFRCGSYKREVAAGVNLCPPVPPPGQKPQWGYLGGRGDLMADAMLCLLKDIGELPGARIKREAPASIAGAAGIAVHQTVGLKKFDSKAKRAELYHQIRVCAPLLGCLDAQRQDIAVQVRETIPAWPAGMRSRDYPVRNSYSLEVTSDWSSAKLGAKLPQFVVATPYGEVTVQPSFDFFASLFPVDTPFNYKGSAKILMSHPGARGPGTPLLQDSYGRSGTPFIVNVATNLKQAMAPCPENLPPGQICVPTPVGPEPAQGWTSQLGLGARNAAYDVKAWSPSGASSTSPPTREDLNMDMPRSLLERAPTANFVAEAIIRFQPPGSQLLKLIPEPIRGYVTIEFWIEVKPRFAADYAAQLALIEREGILVGGCGRGEFGSDCNMAEAVLLAQTRAEGRAEILGDVHLKLGFDFPGPFDPPSVKFDQPFKISLGGGKKWDPPLANPKIDPYAGAARAALLATNPDSIDSHLVKGFSGKGSNDISAWTKQCLQTPPTNVSQAPPPSHEPGSPQDLMPDLLPCNICVADKRQNHYQPFSIFPVDAKVYSKPWKCEWERQQGCYDLCGWDKKTGKFTAAVRSAVDVVGSHCQAPYIPPPR
jgi:hypothetical protein